MAQDTGNGNADQAGHSRVDSVGRFRAANSEQRARAVVRAETVLAPWLSGRFRPSPSDVSPNLSTKAAIRMPATGVILAIDFLSTPKRHCSIFLQSSNAPILSTQSGENNDTFSY